MHDSGSEERALVSGLARRLAIGATTIALLASIGASGVLAGGPPGLAFYVDDVRYRTVATPTDLSGTGAPDHSYDKIYDLGTGINVAEAKPGDRDYNGGRWMVLPVQWAAGVTPVQFTNDAQILAAESAGLLSIATTPVKQFVCPVIKVPGSQR